jgi:hypothetical protein
MPWTTRLAVCLAVFFAVIATAQADVTGVFQSGANASYKIEYRDDKNFRISFAKGGAMMVRGKYFVLQTIGTEVQAMDLATIKKMMQKYNSTDSGGGEILVPKVSFKALNRSETVAGIKGDVFQVTSTYPNGKSTAEEAVLSDDKQVVSLQRAMMILADEGRKMMAAIGQKSAPNPFDAMGSYREKGVLRYGKSIKLKSIDRRKIPNQRFAQPPLMKAK